MCIDTQIHKYTILKDNLNIYYNENDKSEKVKGHSQD